MDVVTLAFFAAVAVFIACFFFPALQFALAVAGGLILGTAFLFRGVRAIRERYLRTAGRFGQEPYVGAAAVREGAFFVLLGFTFLAAGILILWIHLNA